VWRSFCELVQRPDLATDERFVENASRISHYQVLMPIVREIIREKTVDEWLSLLRDAGVPAGRINTIDQALSDEHLHERGIIVELEHPMLGMIKSIATPVHLSGTPLTYYRHPPMLGEHTDEIIRELHYTDDDIKQLRENRVIE
jgi:crotonobetainyl-CoA:carnitine CoA-transferase CaiB-like acyl-CoA transferase